MQIGELAQHTGLTPSRIRFYERIGLLRPAERQANGYRRYPDEAVLTLRLIATAQRAGFSLDELRTLLPEGSTRRWDRPALLAALERKLRAIEALQAQLADNHAQLLAVMAQVQNRPSDIDCATNAQRVLRGLGLTAARARPD